MKRFTDDADGDAAGVVRLGAAQGGLGLPGVAELFLAASLSR